jgi:hypothetical protein
MMPNFWEYFITYRDGAEIRLVRDRDRAWVEKQLDGNPRVLKYQAKPRIEYALPRRSAGPPLKQSRPRKRPQDREANHMYDTVVTINNTHWPASRKENGTLVDLRLFDPTDRSSKPRLMFRPDALRRAGIPEALIEAAAQSSPQGLILFQDLPQFKVCDERPTLQQSTR